MKKRSKKIISKILAFSLIFTCILVFGAFNTYAETAKNPIVLVHGMYSTSSVFSGIMSYLKSNYSSSVNMIAVNLSNANAITDENAKIISDAVNKLKPANGEVDIIAHSLGGGNSFNYINKYSAGNKIDKIVTLGGANRLSGLTAVPSGVVCTSIVGTNDAIVSESLSTLAGAKMVYVNTDHISLLYNDQVNKEIVKALNGASSPENGGSSSSGCDAQYDSIGCDPQN